MKPLMFSILIKILDILTRTMKKLSETYKELGIAFTFPIEIRDANGELTYFENSNNFWERCERDANGNLTYFENSDSYWSKWEHDANDNQTYFEDSDGTRCQW